MGRWGIGVMEYWITLPSLHCSGVIVFSMLNQLHILYLVSLLMDMSVAGVTFAISRRAAELGATSTELGWLGAVWIGVYGALVLLTGHVSDRVGRRKLAVIGCLIASSMTLICSFTTRVPLLLCSARGSAPASRVSGRRSSPGSAKD